MKNNDNIKLALLGFIAIMSVVNTYLLFKNNHSSVQQIETDSKAVAIPANNTKNNPNPMPGQVIETPNAINKPVNQKTTRITFEKYMHEFGKIKQNSVNKYSFKFTNTGDEPLIISDAQGSCGCTVPDYPKEPIAPGKSATIDVEYKPGTQEGMQDKKVTITANTEPAQTILTIKAEVLKEN
jgi:hypothetical protein